MIKTCRSSRREGKKKAPRPKGAARGEQHLQSSGSRAPRGCFSGSGCEGCSWKAAVGFGEEEEKRSCRGGQQLEFLSLQETGRQQTGVGLRHNRERRPRCQNHNSPFCPESCPCAAPGHLQLPPRRSLSSLLMQSQQKISLKLPPAPTKNPQNRKEPQKGQWGRNLGKVPPVPRALTRAAPSTGCPAGTAAPSPGTSHGEELEKTKKSSMNACSPSGFQI